MKMHRLGSLESDRDAQTVNIEAAEKDYNLTLRIAKDMNKNCINQYSAAISNKLRLAV